jgi:hypothetical protein
MEEAKRCELKLPVEIKRTSRIRCGGRVPTGAIAPRNSSKKEDIPPPVRRSARIRGMKRKDYKEVSPEPKDYRGSDYSDDRSPSSWAAAGRDDSDLYIWDEEPKERTPSAAATMAMIAATMEVATTAVMMVETTAMMTPSDYIRCVVKLVITLLTDKTRIHIPSASVQTYTFFTMGFPRFLSIRGARGLLALNQVLI